jgi:hypothetical protein
VTRLVAWPGPDDVRLGDLRGRIEGRGASGGVTHTALRTFNGSAFDRR